MTLTIRLAVAALAISIGRSFIDWGFVYPEFGMTQPAAVFGTLVGYVLAYGTWVWAVVALARGRRAGMWVALGATLVLSDLLGISTTVALCPTPCGTIYPVAEIWNWLTTVSGIAATVALVRSLRSMQGQVAVGAP